MIEFREKINKIDKSKYPKPYLHPEAFTEICPICFEPTTEDDMLHPNDATKQIRIHEQCWKFIRSHWICQGCDLYFSRDEQSYRIPESGPRCKECFERLINHYRSACKRR